MRAILTFEDVPPYLSATAAALLSEARAAYDRHGLNDHSILQAGPHTLLLPWTGSRATTTLTAQLTAAGLNASNDGLIITVANAATSHVHDHLRALAEAWPADAPGLASVVAKKATAKYDEWISDSLLAADYARRALDCPGAWRAAKRLAMQH